MSQVWELGEWGGCVSTCVSQGVRQVCDSGVWARVRGRCESKVYEPGVQATYVSQVCETGVWVRCVSQESETVVWARRVSQECEPSAWASVC